MILAQYIRLEITMGANRSQRYSPTQKLSSQQLECKIQFETKAWLYPCYALTVVYLVTRAYFAGIGEIGCPTSSKQCLLAERGLLISNLAMNIIIFSMALKSIYMIRQSLNHQLDSQVQLRKILKYNPTQIYLFGFVCLMWIGLLIVSFVIGPTTLSQKVNREQAKIPPRFITSLTSALISFVLAKVSVRQRHVHWEMDSTGNILIALETTRQEAVTSSPSFSQNNTMSKIDSIELEHQLAQTFQQQLYM